MAAPRWDIHIQTPHSDYHDLWIDPHDDQRMINGNDGGATVTFDGGQELDRGNESAYRPVLHRSRGQQLSVSCLRRAAGRHHRFSSK